MNTILDLSASFNEKQAENVWEYFQKTSIKTAFDVTRTQEIGKDCNILCTILLSYVDIMTIILIRIIIIITNTMI